MASTSNINAQATLSIQVAGDQTMTYQWQMPSEMLDRVIVTVPQQTPDFKIPLQPANGDKVLFIGIQGSDKSGKVTYDLFGGALPLDGPQIVAGGALINKLNNLPTTVTINNPTTGPVTIDIFVLRVH